MLWKWCLGSGTTTISLQLLVLYATPNCMTPFLYSPHRCYCGKDAFTVPSLRHFDTGVAYHPSCCQGEVLLKV